MKIKLKNWDNDNENRLVEWLCPRSQSELLSALCGQTLPTVQCAVQRWMRFTNIDDNHEDDDGGHLGV